MTGQQYLEGVCRLAINLVVKMCDWAHDYDIKQWILSHNLESTVQA